MRAIVVDDKAVVLTKDFFFSSRRHHTRYWRDWSSAVCSSDLLPEDRAVGVADVVDLLVAERLAQHVHVAGHVGGGHVVEDGAAVPGARGGQLVVGEPLGLLLEIGRASCRERGQISVVHVSSKK